MINQQQLWLQYLDALSDKVKLQAGEALQAIYPYQPWSWGGRSPMPSSYPYEQWELLDVVPSDPLLNANSGAAASQKGFDIAYSNWFNMLAVGDLEHDQPYQQYQDALTNSTRKYTTDYQNAQNLWKNQTGGVSPDFTTWLGQPPQLGIKTSLDQDADDVAAKKTELDQYRKRIATPVQAISDLFANDAYQGLATDPSSGKSVKLRLWNTVPSNPYDYVEQITNNNFGGDATAGSKDTFTFTSESSSYDYSHYFAEGGAGFWDDFIGLEVGGEFERVDWSSFSSEYSISISWQDLATVAVTPDGWYAGANITTYGRQGPYATGFSGFDTGGSNYFFGAGGALSRIYTGLVVAYRPSITISASEEFASYMNQKWKAEAGIEIGPFFFGSKASGETEQSTVEQDGANLVITSQSPWPLIIGMKSAWTLTPAGE